MLNSWVIIVIINYTWNHHIDDVIKEVNKKKGLSEKLFQSVVCDTNNRIMLDLI